MDKKDQRPPLHARVADLEERRQAARLMGGGPRIERQHERGKLTARERLARLCDAQSFEEIGLHADSGSTAEPAAADGIITGIGALDGQPCAIAAWDFTVLGGTLGPSGERKLLRLCRLAARDRLPIVWLLDSIGPRSAAGVDEVDAISRFAGSGAVLTAAARLRGVVPRIAAVLGPARADAAWLAGLSDLSLMVEGTASLALGGPALVHAATGEKLSEEDLAGTRVHTTTSGIAALACPDEATCLDQVRELVGILRGTRSTRPATDEDTSDRLPIDVLDLLPVDPRGAWDVRILLGWIADAPLLELWPTWGPSLFTGFGNLGGRSVGFVANVPAVHSGALDATATRKAGRFVRLCSDFGLPLVFLVDTPGFMIGREAEHGGLLSYGAELFEAVAQADVPRMTVILRRAYGGGYHAMCGRAMEPDLLVAWPTAEISILGPDGMVAVGAGAALRHHHNPRAEKRRLAELIRPHLDVYHAARRGFLDDVIDPRETREVLLATLRRAE